MPFLKISCLVLLAVAVSTAGQTYNRVLLDDPEAVCLDGTPGAHYLYKGDPDKVLVFFYGGGWCGADTMANTIESCYQRSKTDLGSSKNRPATITTAAGLGSGDDKNFFKDWTKVFLTYCDGSGHQGYKKDPIEYKGAKLYFRGEKVVKGHFNSL